MTRRDLLWFAACVPVHAAPRTLFNGRDLSGWTAYGHGKWTVEDGAIAGRFDTQRPGPGYLLTDAEFTDFRLELQFWISKRGNSGVYVRQPLRPFGTKGKEKPAQQAADGHEIQIDYNDPKNLTGAVYNCRNVTTVAGGEERWNKYAIECRGPRVVVWIDGQEVNRFEPLRSPRGVIGFQIHGQTPHDHVVRFRNITIQELA